MSVLSLDGIGRQFGKVHALQKVSFDVEEGQIVGLIGPNGSGKSTLFNIVAGALPATAGRVAFRGRDVTGWRPHQAAAAGVARTFQLTRIFDSMTVLENCVVAAHLRHRGRRAAHAHAAEVVERVGLEDVAHRSAASLTGASRRRLEIARALTTDPQLLLLDEVLSGLTPAEGQEAADLVRKINLDGVSVVMVEHVMEIVMGLCDHLVVLDHGQLVAQGAPEVVSHDPAVIEVYLGRGSEESRAPAPSRPPAANRGEPMLTVTDLRLEYGGVPALAGVNLEVNEGEAVALLGANGAGKTSLLAAISGLHRPVSGSLRFCGQELSRMPPHEIVALGVALVPEGRRLFGKLTVRKNLLLGAYHQRDPRQRQEDLGFVEGLLSVLREKRDMKAEELSGGEQQMVAIGRALMSRPRLLLLDEPSTGLAPEVVDRLFDALPAIRAQGVAILLVEQQVPRALAFADRAYVLQTGRIVGSGPIQEAYGL